MDRPLNIAICEDQNADLNLLLKCIDTLNIPTLCDIFSSGEDLLEVFSSGSYDLIFLDIYMAGMRGIEVAEKIRTTDKSVVIAFTTSSLDHTLESYRLKALRYLEKPVNALDVQETMELALAKHHTRPRLSLMIDGAMHSIPLDNLLYLEQQNHTVIIYTLTEVLSTSQKVKLSQLETMLPAPPFFRCHHSFIVNLGQVLSLDKDLRLFNMANGGKAYIRRQDLSRAQKAYEEVLFSITRSSI